MGFSGKQPISSAKIVGIGGANDADTNTLHGKIGTDTAMGDVPLAEWLKMFGVDGEADIDISEADYTSYQTLLTIAPASGQNILDCVVFLDLNKTTTGFEDVATAEDTIDLLVQRKMDITTWTGQVAATQKTAGSLGDLEAVRFDLGPVTNGQQARIVCKVSAERDDVEIPYRVLYRGKTPTITAVAAA